MELYNDNLVDLYWILDNGKQKGGHGALEPPRLDIKQDAKKMVFIRNAVLKEANSPDELMDLFTAGNLERHVGATKMNAESSRSHSIFAIMVSEFRVSCLPHSCVEISNQGNKYSSSIKYGNSIFNFGSYIIQDHFISNMKQFY